MRGWFSAQSRVLFFSFYFLLMLGTACSTSANKSQNTYKEQDDSRPLVDDQYRLTADRKELDELRAQESHQQKIENDEIAFTLQLMTEVNRTPSSIREKFDTAIRKKRDRFSKDITKERDIFTKYERKNREAFLKNMDQQRADFLKGKHSRDERKEFFDAQDQRRKEFFENYREKRNDFESDVTERRKNFEDYAKERRNDFNEAMRSYQKRYDEYLKNKREAEKQAAAGGKPGNADGSQPASDDGPIEVKSFLQEFMDIPPGAGTTLESGQ